MVSHKQVRVRIAPSPTGYFHIGTARTALFNWLFAKKHGGTFILRIEDTDRERSKQEYEEDIIEGLKWLGLNWDEGPFYQSKNIDIYERAIGDLFEKSSAYYCFCSKQDLEAERSQMLTSGRAPIYSGRCRTLTENEIQAKMHALIPSVIRFRMPETTITFTDMIRGKVTFDTVLLGDIVIAKSRTEPLYNFAVVVDDHESAISHVIRGEDHLANTPKQIAILEALGFERPRYAHLPLILDEARAKLSKRFAATALKEYRMEGYLPDALINFLALLGWHPTHNREIFSREELIREFELERVQKGGAVFSLEKLDWINAQYIKLLSDTELLELFQKSGGFPQIPGKKLDEKSLISVVRDRIKKLSDILPASTPFFELSEYAPELLIWKKTSKSDTIDNLKLVKVKIEELDERSFTLDALKSAFEELAQSRGRGEIFWPLRVALSGLDASPGPFEIMSILGKETTLERVEIAIKKLNAS